MNISDRQTAYVALLCLIFSAVGIWHIIAGSMTERIFRQASAVRTAGIALIVLALPCALWPKPFFIALGGVLGVSGLVRALLPTFNIRKQKQTLPRWGHGCVIIVFAALIWLGHTWWR